MSLPFVIRKNFRSTSCCRNPTARNSCFNSRRTELSCRTSSLTFVRIAIYALSDTVARPRPLLMRGPSLVVVTPVTTWGCFRCRPPSRKRDRRIHYCASTGHLLKLRRRCLERSWPANWLSCDHVSRDFVIRISSGVRGAVLIAAGPVRRRFYGTRSIVNGGGIARASVVTELFTVPRGGGGKKTLP